MKLKEFVFGGLDLLFYLVISNYNCIDESALKLLGEVVPDDRAF